MNLASYSKCRIQYRPNDRQRANIDYSDRSVVELRQYDFGDYSLRAIDVDNNKTEIFNIPIREADQYKRAQKADEPDEIRGRSGIYFLWLTAETRDQFHEALDICIEQLSYGPTRTSSLSSSPSAIEELDNSDNSDPFVNEPVSEPKVSNSPMITPNELLQDTRLLSQYIEEGNTNAAAQVGSRLASRSIRLQAKSLGSTNEIPFTIHVQLDGDDYAVNQHGGRIPLDVFRSTTIRELRAAFELSYQYPPTNQYFFVNGCFARDDATMKDLNVGPNSLFILFFLSHPKNFLTASSWVCSACHANNDQYHARCRTCTAARTE